MKLKHRLCKRDTLSSLPPLSLLESAMEKFEKTMFAATSGKARSDLAPSSGRDWSTFTGPYQKPDIPRSQRRFKTSFLVERKQYEEELQIDIIEHELSRLSMQPQSSSQSDFSPSCSSLL